MGILTVTRGAGLRGGGRSLPGIGLPMMRPGGLRLRTGPRALQSARVGPLRPGLRMRIWSPLSQPVFLHLTRQKARQSGHRRSYLPVSCFYLLKLLWFLLSLPW